MKYNKAVEYYNEGDCGKALPLFEELVSLYRLTEKGEDVYYYYAHTNYCLREYFVANYYFKSFVKTYPGSPKAEECAFMSAMCKVKNSPSPSLDQTETSKAIDELQLFMNRYPTSQHVDSCNNLILKLRDKLETKAINGAKLYMQMENYKSASVAFANVLKDFPDTKYKEEAMFLTLKSNFLLADNSIESKKFERFKETINSYRKFASLFPESKYSREAESYFTASNKRLEDLNK